jgi:hypothetical protein
MAGPDLELSWTTNFANYVLESAPQLQAGWTAVTNPPTISGGRYVVTVSISAGSRFFRLRLQ